MTCRLSSNFNLLLGIGLLASPDGKYLCANSDATHFLHTSPEGG